MSQCEFCGHRAKWRFWRADYERFCCADHVSWLKRLLLLDLGRVQYSFETCEAREEPDKFGRLCWDGGAFDPEEP